MSKAWIGTDEAAEHFGMGKTKFYDLTREGRNRPLLGAA